MLLDRGALGLRVKDVAERAGMAPSSVLYYYPDLADLLFEVTREAMHRYGERRAEAIRELADPAAQLRLAIQLGVPTGPGDEESRLLYELDALTGTSQVFATLSAGFFDRQAALYERVLERGAESGAFTLDRRRGDPGAAGWSRSRTASACRWFSATRASTAPPPRRSSSPGPAPRPAPTWPRSSRPPRPPRAPPPSRRPPRPRRRRPARRRRPRRVVSRWAK